MPDVSRSTTADPDDPWAGNPPEVGPNDVTDARARMLASHAIYVQGGFSDPEREAERARKQLAQSPGSIDWDKMQGELNRALLAKAAELSDQVAAEEAKQQTAGLPIAKLRRYKELREAQAVSEADAKAIKDEANALERELVDEFAEAGVQNINVDGKTIYLHRSVYAQRLEGVDTEAIKAALIADGYGDLVTETVNGSSLNALIRELTDEDDSKGLSEELAKVLTTGERYAVRVIAGGTKAKNRTHSKG